MYEVVVLIEEPLADGDARQLADLYGALPDPTHLHVLLPTADAPTHVEAVLASLSDGSGVPGKPTPPIASDDIGQPTAEEHAAAMADAQAGLTRTLEHLRGLGLDADGELLPDDPLAALESIVAERDSDEVVIMTRTHVVSQFLHMDWASSARRHLDVPVLHLLERSED
ncbi:MAG: hypothetical protein WKH47_07450 [Actinomycetes bacterium]